MTEKDYILSMIKNLSNDNIKNNDKYRQSLLNILYCESLAKKNDFRKDYITYLKNKLQIIPFKNYKEVELNDIKKVLSYRLYRFDELDKSLGIKYSDRLLNRKQIDY